MPDFPSTEKKLKQRISSYRRVLNKEKQTHNYISDGYGKRYLLFCLYLLLGDHLKSQEYLDWYEKEFADDAGEPVQLFCWAIILFRMGEENKARYKLAESMLSNLYVIPFILGRETKAYDMWYSSNYDEISYLDYFPHQIIDAIDDDDREWMAGHYDSFIFQRIRKRHVEIYHELDRLEEVKARRPLVEEAGSLIDLIQ